MIPRSGTRFAACGLFLLSLRCFGETGTITEDFSTYQAAAGTTAIWDTVAKSVHVPFVVEGQESIAIDTGTAADGIFDSATMYTFDLNAGSVPNQIILDTSRTYFFKTFSLPSGATLFGQGSAPLQIKVQGSATIAGTIDLRGGTGGIAFAPATSTTNAGTSCCGGGAGGSGVSGLVGAAAGTGLSPASGSGGLPGTVSAAGGTDGGAGGGGGNTFVGGNGAVNASASGVGGPSYADPLLEALLGGAGGGGGAGNTALGSPSAGAGGGGGGGAVSFYVGGDFHVTSTGQILVTGGSGGSAGAPLKAGGGGGGAGGVVRIYAGGTGADDGGINAQGGSGGVATVSGGIGSDGVNRFAFVDGTIGGTPVLGGENPPPAGGIILRTYASVQSFTVISKPYDTQNSNPHYTSFTAADTVHAGDTLTYEVAGSNDQFVSDDTGYFPAANIARLNGKRYFRYRITMQSATTASSPSVQSITVSYGLNYAFSISGCGRAAAPTGGGPWGWFWIFGYLGLLNVAARHWLARSRPTPKPKTNSLQNSIR